MMNEESIRVSVGALQKEQLRKALLEVIEMSANKTISIKNNRN